MVVFAANAQRAPPHAVGRGFSSSTPRQVAGGGFGTSCLPYSTPVVRSPCALRPVENRPTAHEACARCRTWRSCLRGHRATHSTPRCWPRLFFTDTASRRRLRLRHVTKPRSAPMLRDPRALRPVENQPADGPHSTCAGGLGVRGCLRGQRRDVLHSTSLTELFFIDIVPSRRLRLRNIVANACNPRGARRVRASLPREPAYGPRSTCALADLAWLSLRPTRDALHPMPLAEALPHRQRLRSAAAVSKRRYRRVRIPRHAACARFAPWRNGRRPTEHARAGGLGVVVFAANARRAPPHAVGRGSSAPTPRQVGGGSFKTS